MIDNTISAKVLTVGPEYNPPKGGIAKVIDSYSRIISPFKFIKTYRPGAGKAEQLALIASAWLKFCFQCCFGGIRIVHVHCCSNNSFRRKGIFILTGKILGKKVVCHIHGGGFDRFSMQHRRTAGFILRKADTIIALSSFWKDFFEKEFSLKRIRIVPNIVDEPVVRCEKSPIAEALFLGDLCEAKGIFDLLDMIASHRNELRGKFHLHIGGNGDAGRLESFIKEYGIGDMVSYDGWVAGEAKERLLSEANIFILPSYVEGLPISILEAMSYGMAVVSTTVGGIPEIVKNGENGFLIAPGDKDALFRAVSQLADNAALKSGMGKKSSEAVAPFLPGNVSKSLEGIYSELLNI